jgi:NAD-dependent oxidoreductase involved in siderophore biosynthesis
MSLENLLNIGLLKEHPIQGEEIERLLLAARRNLRDAGVETISPETRFDAAYTAIMQCALADVVAWRKANRPELIPNWRK